jgi:hypothetical protein
VDLPSIGQIVKNVYSAFRQIFLSKIKNAFLVIMPKALPNARIVIIIFIPMENVGHVNLLIIALNAVTVNPRVSIIRKKIIAKFVRWHQKRNANNIIAQGSVIIMVRAVILS